MQKQLVWLLLLIIIFISGCSSDSSPDQVKSQVCVVVAEAKEEALQTKFSYQAVLQPAEPREICAQISGVIKSVHIKAGQLVSRGDYLLLLEDQPAGLDLNNARQEVVQAWSQNEQLQARLQDLSASLERQQTLYDSGAISSQELEKDQLEFTLLQHQVNQAESQLARAMNKQQQAELDFNNCRITAPDNMIVSECLVDAGQYIKVGQVLLRGGKARKLQMVIEVPREEALPWKIGDGLRVSSQGEEREAVINHISNLVLNGTSRIEVVLQIDNHDLKWNSGEWVSVSDTVPIAKQIVVPLEAVAQGDTPYVYIVKDGRVHKHNIKLGTAEGSKIAVKGIEAGTLVVKGGLPSLCDGQTVDYRKEDGSQ